MLLRLVVIAALCPLLSCSAPRLAGQTVNTTISVLDYGADPTGGSDSTTAFNNWWSACSTETTESLSAAFPSGTYLFNSNLVWDFTGNPGGGVFVQGAGQNKTLLKFATGKHLSIIDSTSNGSAFYGIFNNFGVLANYSTGAALQLGQTNFSDALNGFAFRDIWVKNLANASGSEALELNEVYSSAFSNITTSDGCTDGNGNCPSGGDSVLLTQASFNILQGSFSGARNGVRLASGYNFGNVFTSLDLEVNSYDLVIDNAQSAHNIFIGGQWGYDANAIYASAGSGNIVEHANFAPASAYAGAVVGMASGLTVKGTYALVSTPAFPSSGQVVANTTGRDVSVNLYSMTNPTVCYGASATTCITPGASTTVLLRSGDSIKVSYSMGGGGWVWLETN